MTPGLLRTACTTFRGLLVVMNTYAQTFKVPSLVERKSAERLAVGAEVSAPAAHFCAGYIRAANIARLPCATKDLHAQLVRPLAAGGIDVVTEGRATVPQGVVQDPADGAMQASILPIVEHAGRSKRVQARREKRLIGVDLPGRDGCWSGGRP
jgi:hypothetical protein